MNVTETDRKRLASIARGAQYGATLRDLVWLVGFAEKLLKERDDHTRDTRSERRQPAKTRH
jgi:hypothetical protein